VPPLGYRRGKFFFVVFANDRLCSFTGYGSTSGRSSTGYGSTSGRSFTGYGSTSGRSFTVRGRLEGHRDRWFVRWLVFDRFIFEESALWIGLADLQFPRHRGRIVEVGHHATAWPFRHFDQADLFQAGDPSPGGAASPIEGGRQLRELDRDRLWPAIVLAP